MLSQIFYAQYILYKVEILNIDESDCGLIFSLCLQEIWISPEGGTGKYSRKTLATKWLRSIEFGFALF